MLINSDVNRWNAVYADTTVSSRVGSGSIINLFAFILTFLCLLPIQAIAAAGLREHPPHGQVVAAYFSEWTIFTEGYTVADIPAERLTHVVYAFIQIKDGEVAFVDEYAALEAPLARDDSQSWPDGNLPQLRTLRERHPHLELLVALGGWTLSSPFSDAVLTDESRARLARSIVRFLREHDFDGIDLDWEYPVGGGLEDNVTRPEDKQNYTLFVAELRRQLNRASESNGRRYRITVASPASESTLQHFELKSMARYIDWYHVMAYDYHGAWELTTGHLAPLDGDGDAASIRRSIRAYRDAGVPTSKIVLGIPLYGRAWSGVSDSNNGLRQPAQRPYAGTTEEGYITYRQLRKRVRANPAGYREYFDDSAQAGFIFNRELDEGSFFSAETVETFELKRQFARRQGLRGLMFWSLEGEMADLHDSDSLIGRLPVLSERSSALNASSD
jgi:chitinase